jgi:hypothetical protein
MQRVGDQIYFQVRFDLPVDMDNPPGDRPLAGGVVPILPDWTRRPRLIPQDGQAHAVYHRFEIPVSPVTPPGSPAANGRAPEPNGEVPAVQGLEFLGKAAQETTVKFLLLYPTRPHGWAEVPVTLDLATAQKVAVPAQASQRKSDRALAAADLEALWAVAQAEQFAVLESLAPDLSFYSFAREATARKYGVPNRSLPGGWMQPVSRELVDRQLYETTTGAAALTESLQRQRMLNPGSRDTGARTVSVKSVPGIDIAEHPWQELIGKQKPAIEPLARFVPADNYYLHFTHIQKLIELGDLLDQWGTNLLRAYEINSRDLRLQQRYEKQLCLRSSTLGRLLGPQVVDSLAITGNDFYLREGSDITILFRVRSRPLFLAGAEPFLQEARKEFAGKLEEAKEDYHGVKVESYVTPLREVSLHRAALDDVVIYSNSPVGLRRVLDARQGRLKDLADSLDFQYMRTVFRGNDPEEDGFLFLSDPFIRQFVGPASKIKEKRRLEALTSLTMLTNGVLFTAWETAPRPAGQHAALTPTGLKPDELYAPGARDVAWDASRQVAVSDVYNTEQFATPLVELPIDQVTSAEAEGYRRFRAEYLGLWRQYFDPVGMRLRLRDAEVRIETYILPLIQSSQYNWLREHFGAGTTPLDPARIPSTTVAQFLTHLNPRGVKAQLTSALNLLGDRVKLDFLGDWFLVRLEDSPNYAKLAELQMRSEQGQEADNRQGMMELAFQIPLTVGVGVRNPLLLAGFLGVIRGTVLAAAPGMVSWEPLEQPYKGVSIVRIQALVDPLTGMAWPPGDKPGAKPFRPAVYYATIDGNLYASLTEPTLKQLIDASAARRAGKDLGSPRQSIPVNSSLYLSPGTPAQTGAVIRMFLEQEVSKRTLANEPVLYVLYRTGLVDAGTLPQEVQRMALRYFGFVPVSPDSSAYAYDSKTAEVTNERHGTQRAPHRHMTLDPASPVNRLLEQVQSLRADLRFREDGVQTVLTLRRKAPSK